MRVDQADNLNDRVHKIGLWPVCLISVIGLLILLSSPAIAGVGKKVRDWSVWCDDILKCQMYIYTSSRQIYSFGFNRSPKANSEIVPFLTLAPEVDTSGSIVLVVDGKHEFELAFSEAELEEGVWHFPGQDKERNILQALMDGSDLVITAIKGGEKVKVPVSLSGVTGSALFVDEAQGRVGNQDALQAKGEGIPVDAETRVTLLSSSADLPASIAQFWQEHTGGCAEGYPEGQDLIKDYGGLSISVDDNAVIYVMPCGSPGAYNLPYVLLIHDTELKQARRLYFPVMGQEGPTLMDTAYNVNWDDKKSTLSAFFKGRGIGDCGLRHTWRWQGGYYSSLELVEEFRKDNCDERHDNWPRLWPPG